MVVLAQYSSPSPTTQTLKAWCSRKIRSSGGLWTVLTKKERKRGLPNSRTCLIRGDGPHHVEIVDCHYDLAISHDRQKCQFLFLLDEKPTVVPVGSAGEQSGGAQEVPYGAVRSNSERAAPSAWVAKRFSAPQIVWNRST